MLVSCFRALLKYCNVLGFGSFILLSTSACENTPAPPQPTDPDTVARRVIADFLSLSITDVILVSIEAREFNDSSLDCPEPKKAYQQVITPGHLAIVEAQGRRFEVRIAGSHGKICRNGKRNPSKNSADRKSPVTVMIDLARLDLAGLLDVETSGIHILDVRVYDGKNPPTGCAPQCADNDKSCGYLIGLFYESRRYDYHATGGKVTACPPILRL